jgi:malate dehydrogenase (oxaloacetate-decarboxylating)(NADP+)
VDSKKDLLRLQAQLKALPSDLMRHTQLSRVRREDPRLFFAALREDLIGL